MNPREFDTILDVGVSEEITEEANVLEKHYPFPQNIVCASIGDGAKIKIEYPEVTHIRIHPNKALPFKDREFTISYSNAVLEHVGDACNQRYFLLEMFRVAKHVFLVVPNRLFPVEHHTGLPLIHYLPKKMFRSLLRGSRFDFWSYEKNLDLILAGDVRKIWPHGVEPTMFYSGVGIGMFKSNIVIFSKRE